MLYKGKFKHSDAHQRLLHDESSRMGRQISESSPKENKLYTVYMVCVAQDRRPPTAYLVKVYTYILYTIWRTVLRHSWNTQGLLSLILSTYLLPFFLSPLILFSPPLSSLYFHRSAFRCHRIIDLFSRGALNITRNSNNRRWCFRMRHCFSRIFRLSSFPPVLHQLFYRPQKQSSPSL